MALIYIRELITILVLYTLVVGFINTKLDYLDPSS